MPVSVLIPSVRKPVPHYFAWPTSRSVTCQENTGSIWIGLSVESVSWRCCHVYWNRATDCKANTQFTPKFDSRTWAPGLYTTVLFSLYLSLSFNISIYLLLVFFCNIPAYRPSTARFSMVSRLALDKRR